MMALYCCTVAFTFAFRILNQLDVKNRILALMGHDNQEVNKQALLCVQKIMVQKWVCRALCIVLMTGSFSTKF